MPLGSISDWGMSNTLQYSTSLFDILHLKDRTTLESISLFVSVWDIHASYLQHGTSVNFESGVWQYQLFIHLYNHKYTVLCSWSIITKENKKVQHIDRFETL